MTDLRIKTIPNTRKEFIEERDGRYIVGVDAPQEDGKANERLCRVLARHFSVAAEDVRIIRGKTQTSKLVRIQNKHT